MASDTPQEVLSYFGGVLSIVFLAITIVTYMSTRYSEL